MDSIDIMIRSLFPRQAVLTLIYLLVSHAGRCGLIPHGHLADLSHGIVIWRAVSQPSGSDPYAQFPSPTACMQHIVQKERMLPG